jgi:glutathionyl-hydroquinone reductase
MASGIMVAGKWLVDGNERTQNGEFHEIPTTFRHYITADGSSGLKAEAGRYHLYVALGCPWAHRTLIMREIKLTFHGKSSTNQNT